MMTIYFVYFIYFSCFFQNMYVLFKAFFFNFTSIQKFIIVIIHLYKVVVDYIDLIYRVLQIIILNINFYRYFILKFKLIFYFFFQIFSSFFILYFIIVIINIIIIAIAIIDIRFIVNFVVIAVIRNFALNLDYKTFKVFIRSVLLIKVIALYKI